MNEKDLPDNIIPISTLRIKYDKTKKCTCKNRRFEVDVVNREVLCADCGATVDAFEAIKEIAFDLCHLESETEALLNQRKQILNWKPHLLVIRELERIYRSDMFPCCPHCGRGIDAHELIRTQVNKKMEMERRKFKK
jgi:hypothetical protein